MIYHYTSIETLALILDSRNIRFNNLTAVDDIFEGSLFNKANLAQFIFVSCWTKDNEENIALWKMYTHGKGVRIGLPDYPWKKNIYNLSEWKDLGIDLRNNLNKIQYGPFKVSDIFGEKHFIMPPYCLPMPNEGVFTKDVVYLDDQMLEDKYKDIYNHKLNEANGTFEIKIAPIEFGKFKHKRWAFQNEFRFVMFICPLDRKYDVKDKNAMNLMTTTFYDYLQNERESPIKDFYVELSDEAISNMEITLGPLSTSADEIIVKALLANKGIEIPLKKSKSGLRK